MSAVLRHSWKLEFKQCIGMLPSHYLRRYIGCPLGGFRAGFRLEISTSFYCTRLYEHLLGACFEMERRFAHLHKLSHIP
jgi:hypothetical protein